jgi:hypothetical protein
MWTLATATLAGLDLPDSVPNSYPHRREIPTLTDHVSLEMDTRDLEHARRAADQSVAEIKQLLFARYDLA